MICDYCKSYLVDCECKIQNRPKYEASKKKTFTFWVGSDVLKNDVILAYKTRELAELNVFPPAERIEITREEE